VVGLDVPFELLHSCFGHSGDETRHGHVQLVGPLLPPLTLFVRRVDGSRVPILKGKADTTLQFRYRSTVEYRLRSASVVSRDEGDAIRTTNNRADSIDAIRQTVEGDLHGRENDADSDDVPIFVPVNRGFVRVLFGSGSEGSFWLGTVRGRHSIGPVAPSSSLEGTDERSVATLFLLWLIFEAYLE